MQQAVPTPCNKQVRLWLVLATRQPTHTHTHNTYTGDTFAQLLQEYNIKGRDTIIAQPGEHQLGLYARQPASKDDVLLSVPLSLCLYVNYQGEGLQLPVGGWPRLSQAVAKDDAMNWDLLMVCVLGGGGGNGGEGCCLTCACCWYTYTRKCTHANK